MGEDAKGINVKITFVFASLNSTPILRRKKDGDWYIYPQFLAHENFKNVQQKGCKIFKTSIHNVLSTGTNVVKIWLSLCLIRCVRFARYCGKMYSRHLFSYGGLHRLLMVSICINNNPDSLSITLISTLVSQNSAFVI